MRLGIALADFRRNIAKRRQTEVAEKVGITQTYLSQIESGNKIPTYEVVQKLCREYKVPLAVISWNAIEEKDVDKSKRTAFKRIKPVVDDLITGFLINNF